MAAGEGAIETGSITSELTFRPSSVHKRRMSAYVVSMPAAAAARAAGASALGAPGAGSAAAPAAVAPAAAARRSRTFSTTVV